MRVLLSTVVSGNLKNIYISYKTAKCKGCNPLSEITRMRHNIFPQINCMQLIFVSKQRVKKCCHLLYAHIMG